LRQDWKTNAIEERAGWMALEQKNKEIFECIVGRTEMSRLQKDQVEELYCVGWKMWERER
jgi:hypothetical protein